jgi:hypothetical protein
MSWTAGQLDHDLVRALLADLGLGDAELVDAVAHDVDRAVDVLGREHVALRRLRLEDDLEAALEVEALAEALVRRRAGPADEAHADERARAAPTSVRWSAAKPS